MAEATAREMGLSLEEPYNSSCCTRLTSRRSSSGQRRGGSAATTSTRKAVSLLKAQLTLSALAELRAGEREAAAKLLMELVGR
jgi:hypothetical protein